jgi:hypothetical protein
LMIGAVHLARVDRVDNQSNQRQQTDQKRPALKAVGLALVGIIAAYYFWRKVYFSTDSFRWSGWLWFVGLVESLCIFGMVSICFC